MGLIHVRCNMQISFLITGMICYESHEIAGSNLSKSEKSDVKLELSELNEFQHEKLLMYSSLNQSYYWRCLCLMMALESYF